MVHAQATGLSVAGEQVERAEEKLFDLGSDKKTESNLENNSTYKIVNRLARQASFISGSFHFSYLICGVEVSGHPSNYRIILASSLG